MSGNLSVRIRSAPQSRTMDKPLCLAGVSFLIWKTGNLGGMAQSFLLAVKHSIRGSLILPSIHLMLAYTLQPPLTPSCSLNMSGPPQGLCTWYSCCPDIPLAYSFPSFRFSHSDHLLQQASWAIQSKIRTFPPWTCLVFFLFLVCFALINICIILYILLICSAHYLFHIL